MSFGPGRAEQPERLQRFQTLQSKAVAALLVSGGKTERREGFAKYFFLQNLKVLQTLRGIATSRKIPCRT
jgi:hypothetical protein